jgi:bacillithiol system protein YtxJ
VRKVDLKFKQMSSVVTVKTPRDLLQLIELSQEKPVFLFKHSSRCPISAWAVKEYQSFAKNLDPASPLSCALVRVIEDRNLSEQVTRQLAVEHESPQLLLISGGKVIWHDSHWSLTKGKMQAVIDEFAP